MSPQTTAKTLKVEGSYGPKTTIYYIVFRVSRIRREGQPLDVQQKSGKPPISACFGVDPSPSVRFSSPDLSIPLPPYLVSRTSLR